MLTCHNCKRHWHHTCHLPVITEDELIALVTASTRKASYGTLELWLCRRCKNRTSAPAAAGGSIRTGSFSAPSASGGTIDLTASPPKTRTATREVSIISIDDVPQDGPRSSSSGNQSSQRSGRNQVIELLDDSDNEIIEVTPTPVRKAISARSAETHRPSRPAMPLLSPSTEIDIRDDAEETSRRPSVASSATVTSGGISSSISRDPTVSTRLLDLTLDTPSSHSSLPPPSPQYLPPKASTSDFRKLIADMRAQGKLNPAPPLVPIWKTPEHTDSTSMDVDSYLDGNATASRHESPTPQLDSDSDVEMVDRHENEPEDPPMPVREHSDPHEIDSPPPDRQYSDPNDIEDMYGAEPPPRVMKEEQLDRVVPPSQAVPIHPAPERDVGACAGARAETGRSAK
ncbi:hypothetical protein NM688_g223 [Phlebia brevispora]|uniref:Uncharacterized protein n=1 Tax=Phlebia brevispora TaxID=194682 RepID=A0ACC1TF46_9APHY|nr:hypothetical protein NM688_g223 [Phlebia brevispora]